MLATLILSAVLSSTPSFVAPAPADGPRLEVRAASGLLLPALRPPSTGLRFASEDLSTNDAATQDRIDQAAQIDAHYAGRTVATILAIAGGIVVGGVAGGFGGFALATNVVPGFGSDPAAGFVMMFLLPVGGAMVGAAAGGALGGILANVLYPRFEYQPGGTEGQRLRTLPRNAITVAALHPLGGIYSVEYERRLSDAATIFIAPRAVHRRAPGQNEGGVGGALGGRWYFAHLAPRGLFAEAAVHVRHRQARGGDDVTVNRYSDVSAGGELSAGVAFLLADHLLISLGLGIEGEQIWWDYTSTSPSNPIPPRGSRFALQPHGRASLGFAF